MTHPLTLVLHPEEELLAAVEGDPEEFYRRYFLPYRLYGYLAYQRRRTAWTDLAVLLRTALALAFSRRSNTRPSASTSRHQTLGSGSSASNETRRPAA